MRKLLVATHGRFASGIMETFKLIMGENEDISEISAWVESSFTDWLGTGFGFGCFNR